MITWFRLLKLSGFYVIYWMSSVNKAAELFFRNWRFCLSWEDGCSVCLRGKGGVAERGDASLGGAVTCLLISIPALCPQQTLALWVIVAWLRLLIEKYVHTTFMERPQTHLIFQFWHRPGFGVGLVLVNLVNSSGGGKSDISTNIIWSVICLEVQVLRDVSDWYLYHCP